MTSLALQLTVQLLSVSIHQLTTAVSAHIPALQVRISVADNSTPHQGLNLKLIQLHYKILNLNNKHFKTIFRVSEHTFSPENLAISGLNIMLFIISINDLIVPIQCPKTLPNNRLGLLEVDAKRG